MKGSVGIIANPQSGKDIRRLIAHASVFDNMEKANIVERLLTTLQQFGVEKVLAMPESFGIVNAALRSVSNPVIDVEFLDIEVSGTWEDTFVAAQRMEKACEVIVVLGGDGTNRIVAKAIDKTPIMPISTGTNNVFSRLIEATIAAEAVAAISLGIVDKEEAAERTKRIELFEGKDLKDLALIDLAATCYAFLGARAVWEPEKILELVLSRAQPYSIGLSSIGGILNEIDGSMDGGLYVEFGKGKNVRAPIAPGVVKEVSIKNFKAVKLNENIELKNRSALFALDGERELEASGDLSAKVTRNGPFVIDHKKAITLAAERGMFDA